MHVGVALGDIEPLAGGGFTFVHDVVEAFLQLANESTHRFTLLAPQSYIDSMQGRVLADNIKVVPSRKPSFLDRGVSQLRHYLPIFGYVWRRPSCMERQIASLGIELVWLTGGSYGTFDTPYVTTVWDIQHLTYPWFPEISANWTWDHRELSLRRHLRRATSIIVGTRAGKNKSFGITEFPRSISLFYRILLPDLRSGRLPKPLPTNFHPRSQRNTYCTRLNSGLIRTI